MIVKVLKFRSYLVVKTMNSVFAAKILKQAEEKVNEVELPLEGVIKDYI